MAGDNVRGLGALVRQGAAGRGGGSQGGSRSLTRPSSATLQNEADCRTAPATPGLLITHWTESSYH